MSADTIQAAWDRETAAQVRQRLRHLSRAVRDRQQAEAAARERYRDLRAEYREAMRQLTTAIEQDAADDLTCIRGVLAAGAHDAAAAQALAEARAAWKLAIARRQEAAEELRSFARGLNERHPLLEWAAQQNASAPDAPPRPRRATTP